MSEVAVPNPASLPERLRSLLHATRNPFDGTHWGATLFAALIIVVVPTLVYKHLSSRFGFVGPWFNIDFVIAYGVMLVGSRIHNNWLVRLGYLIILASFTVQVLVGIGVIYLVDPVLITDYLAFASYWPWGEILKWLGLALLALIVVYLALRQVPLRKAHIWPVVLIGFALVAVEHFGQAALTRNRMGVNVVTSGARSIFHLGDALLHYKGFTYKPLTTPSMDRIVSDMPADQRPGHILSLSVEALGRFNDESQNTAMFAPLIAAVGQDYTVSFDRRIFKGATLSGEMRALCGIEAMGTPGKRSIAEIAPNCLPRKLAAQGYATLGIHGNTSHFYNRQEIYPGIGFGQVMFLEDFSRSLGEKAICRDNTFAGVCDRTSLAAALDFFGKHDRAFVHLMTLQTHFPMSPSSLGDTQCGKVGTLTDPELCLYVNSMSNLLGQLGAQIVASPSAPEKIYIFGDHAPPYAVAQLRDQFDRGHVPFITLTRIAR